MAAAKEASYAFEVVSSRLGLFGLRGLLLRFAYLAAATLLTAHGRSRRVLQSLPRQLATSVSPAPSPSPILCTCQKTNKKLMFFNR